MTVSDASVLAAIRELQATLERLRTDLASKDAELARLRESLAERDARIRGLGEQALHLLDLLHEARGSSAAPAGGPATAASSE